MAYLVKLCGTTTVDDAQMAVDYGAHYSGLVVEVSFSERSITVDQAKQLRQQTLIPTVVLFFNQTTDWVLSAVEAAGFEDGLYIASDRYGMPWMSGGGCLITRDFLRMGLLFARKGMGIGNRKVGSSSFFNKTYSNKLDL